MTKLMIATMLLLLLLPMINIPKEAKLSQLHDRDSIQTNVLFVMPGCFNGLCWSLLWEGPE